MNNVRKGKIRIDEKIVLGDHKLFLEIFTWLNFVPINATRLHFKKEFLYVGFSKRFALIDEGSPAPEYKISIKESNKRIKFRLYKERS